MHFITTVPSSSTGEQCLDNPLHRSLYQLLLLLQHQIITCFSRLAIMKVWIAWRRTYNFASRMHRPTTNPTQCCTWWEIMSFPAVSDLRVKWLYILYSTTHLDAQILLSNCLSLCVLPMKLYWVSICYVITPGCSETWRADEKKEGWNC